MIPSSIMVRRKAKSKPKWISQLESVIAGHAPEAGAGLYGASVPVEAAAMVLLNVGWDRTASYGKGTAAAPTAIRAASHQLDFFDPVFGTAVNVGIVACDLKAPVPFVLSTELEEVNAASERLNTSVYNDAHSYLKQKKLVGVIGGEHSAPYGLMKALSEAHREFGILHIDAHHDLRLAYEGYEHSHASIMRNALTDFHQIKHLVSVGIRDFAKEELEFARLNKKRVTTYYDRDWQRDLLDGESYSKLVKTALKPLPQKVYISFDIDGLDPALCPGTGTPVPGGLSFAQAAILIEELVRSKRQVIGFDLCEVAPQANDREWNANVGARVLYKLCGAAAVSNKMLSLI